MPNSDGREVGVFQYAKRIRASGGKQKAPALKSNHPPDTNEETVPVMACLLRLPRFFFPPFSFFLSFFYLGFMTVYNVTVSSSNSFPVFCTDVFTSEMLTWLFRCSSLRIILVTFIQRENINQLRRRKAIFQFLRIG